MQLYFIRHGQSENNLLWTQTGSFAGRSEDPDLTALGRRQAQALAQFLQRPAPESGTRPEFDPQNVHGFALTHLYCSLMIRAISTGAILASALGLPLMGHLDLHEVGGIHHRHEETGEPVGLPGRNRAELLAHCPDLILPDSVGSEGWWSRPYEREEQASVRAQRFLADLYARHGATEHRVAVISHGGFHNHLVRTILNLPADPRLWFSLNNTAVTRFDLDGENAWISYMNRADHLPRELIT